MSKFDMALQIVANPKYDGKLNFGQLRKLDVAQLKQIYIKYKNER